jgi:hypothetical protein
MNDEEYYNIRTYLIDEIERNAVQRDFKNNIYNQYS